MSIRLRLTIWYTLILAIVLVAFGLSLYFFMSFTVRGDLQDNLDKLAKDVNSQIRVVGISKYQDTVVIQLPDLDTFQFPGIYLQAINTANGRLTQSSNLHAKIPFSEHDLKRTEAGEAFFKEVGIGGVQLLVYQWPMQINGHMIGVLQVASNIDAMLQSSENLRLILISAGLVALILAASLGWFLARQALQPIEFIRKEAEKIERGDDLNMRLQYLGPNDEIGRLTETINGMFERLQQVYEDLQESVMSQRRFVSDASHELRTPLTTIRGNVDYLKKVLINIGQEESRDEILTASEAVIDISSEAERMSRLVNDLLHLARADAGIVFEKKPILVSRVLEEMNHRVRWMVRNSHWQLGDLSALNDVYVLGSADYLLQMLTIFIENSFKYTPKGSVDLTVKHEYNKQRVGIQITDTGIGMEAKHIPHIFKRFYRIDASRGETTGTGLGLSIAKWICDEHQGTIELYTECGIGTTFIIWLPIVESPMGAQERNENGSH